MPVSRICTAAAGLALVMTIAAVGITAANRSLTREAAERQQLINQAILWSRITTRLANSLALVASRDNDARLRKLLEAQGITPNAAANGETGRPAAAPPAGATTGATTGAAK